MAGVERWRAIAARLSQIRHEPRPPQ
jgi:hypothetical protein